MAKREDWVWLPHAAHLIVSRNCRYHLATCVGGYIVSTVGEYVPDEGVREIMAQGRGVTLEGRGDARLADFMAKVGFVEIGYGRLYETYVFRARPHDKARGEPGCCLFLVDDHQEVDGVGSNDPACAYANHMRLCEEWAAKD